MKPKWKRGENEKGKKTRAKWYRTLVRFVCFFFNGPTKIEKKTDKGS